MKKSVNNSGWRAGARRMVSAAGAGLAPRRGPRILMYHRVCESDHRLAVRPDLFRRHLDLFQELELEVLSVKDLLARRREAGLRAVALSFDDGYAEMGGLVAEELSARGMGATFYVLPRFAAEPEVISPEACFPDGGARYLDLEGIRALHRHGFEIGSHGLSHRSLTLLDPEESWREISLSRHELTDLLGVPVTGFAFPRGHYHPHHRGQVAAAGYAYGVSVRPGRVSDGKTPWDLPRTEVAGGDSDELLADKLAGGLDLWHGALQWARELKDTSPRYER